MTNLTDDEWNLKKERFLMDDAPNDGDPCLYHSDDIETLREKIIDDINKHFRYSLDACTFEEYSHEKPIIEIINKRFGVE